MSINEIIQCLWLVFPLLFLGVILWTVSTHFKHKRSERLILKFADYTAVLTFFMEKAYELIHKDKILIYSLEATKLPDKDFNRFSKDFIRLVEKLLGPTLVVEFIYFFGNYDTFIFNLVEFFNSRYEGDEIRKASMENLMQSDLEVPEELKHESTVPTIPGQIGRG